MLPIDLEDKVALVTGCTQGIGLGIARLMARAGCSIAGCGLSPENSTKASEFLRQINREGRKVIYRQADIRSEAEVNSFVRAAVDEYGRIDFLVSNAFSKLI
ncbi:MAG: SDR family NAD(P)-dependent oxidoreductase [Anditalea sp.]